MKKNKKLYTIVLVFCLTFNSVFFAKVPLARAQWGAEMAAAVYDSVMEKLMAHLQGIIMGAMKQSAITSISQTVNNLVAGSSSSGALFITNWEDYLVASPLSNTAVYMNDFFATTTRGRSSVSNFTSSVGGGAGYSNYLVENAKAHIMSQMYLNADGMQTNFTDYKVEPGEMFKDNNWRAFSSFISKPSNNPIGYTLMAEEVHNAKLADERREAEVKAEAYSGFKSQEKGGQVVTPGSTVQDIQSQVFDAGYKVIAGAQSVPEVITALVSRIATKAITQGIGNAQRNIIREPAATAHPWLSPNSQDASASDWVNPNY